VLATRIDRLAGSMFELFAIVKKIIDGDFARHTKKPRTGTSER